LICRECKEDYPKEEYSRIGPWYVKACKKCVRVKNRELARKKAKELKKNKWF
jgi:hypothetical protein